MELCPLPVIYLRPSYGGGNEDNSDLLQKAPCSTATLSAPNPAPTHTSTGDSWTPPNKSGSVSCGVPAPFSWVLVHTRFCLCPPRVYFPVLCKFWQLYSGVNDDLVQEALCHTQVCCTQSPWPCGSPLLTRTSTGDGKTQFCLSICGVSGSWCAQGLFEPSEHLWQEWGLILSMNLPLLLSCWGFSFAPGNGVSPHSHSRDVQWPLQFGDSKHPLPTTQEKTLLMDITRWSMTKSD